MKNLILAAIANTQEVVPGYLEKMLAERNPGPHQAGSFFSEMQTIDSLRKAAELAIEVDVGDAKFGDCRYFSLPIPGTVGVVPLASLQQDLYVDLLDPKGTVGTEGGSAEVYLRDDQSTVDRSRVGFTILSIGKEKGVDVVFTLHPGPAAPRPKAINDSSLVNKKVTVAEARKLGFVIAKLTR